MPRRPRYSRLRNAATAAATASKEDQKRAARRAGILVAVALLLAGGGFVALLYFESWGPWVTTTNPLSASLPPPPSSSTAPPPVISISSSSSSSSQPQSAFLAESSYAIPSFSLTSVQFPANWGEAFFAKLAHADEILVRVAVLGDSFSAGSCCSVQFPALNGTGYVQLLMQQFQADYGDGGSGLQSITSNPTTGGNSGYSAPQLPVFVSGYFSDHGGLGGASVDNIVYVANGAGDVISSYLRGTSISIIYLLLPGGGTFTVALDGVFLSTVNTSAPVMTPANLMIDAAEGEHTLTLVTLDALPVAFVSVTASNPTGVVVDNMSVPGLALASLIPMYPSIVSSSDGGLYFMADLLIIEMGLNDIGNAPTSTYLANLQDVITQFQDNGVSSILILMPNAGNDNGTEWDAMRWGAAGLARQLEVAIIDLTNNTLYTYADMAAAGFYAYSAEAQAAACAFPVGQPSTSTADANQAHPSDVGHYNMAKTIYPWISSPLYRTSSIATLT